MYLSMTGAIQSQQGKESSKNTIPPESPPSASGNSQSEEDEEETPVRDNTIGSNSNSGSIDSPSSKSDSSSSSSTDSEQVKEEELDLLCRSDLSSTASELAEEDEDIDETVDAPGTASASNSVAASTSTRSSSKLRKSFSEGDGSTSTRKISNRSTPGLDIPTLSPQTLRKTLQAAAIMEDSASIETDATPRVGPKSPVPMLQKTETSYDLMTSTKKQERLQPSKAALSSRMKSSEPDKEEAKTTPKERIGWWKLGRSDNKTKGKVTVEDDVGSEDGVVIGDAGGKNSTLDAAQRRRDSNNSKLRLLLNESQNSDIPKGQPSVASSVSDSLTANSGPSMMFNMRDRKNSNRYKYSSNKHSHQKRHRFGSGSLTSGNASVTSFRSSLSYRSGGEESVTSMVKDMTNVVDHFTEAHSKELTKMKFIILGVLLICTIAACGVVYFIVKQMTEDESETEYDMISDHVFDTLSTRIVSMFSAMDWFVISMISFAENTNSIPVATGSESGNEGNPGVQTNAGEDDGDSLSMESWPFVTIPNYDVRASKFRSLMASGSGDGENESPIIHVGQYHWVDSSQRRLWESYTSRASSEWVEQSLIVQHAYNASNKSLLQTNEDFSATIRDFTGTHVPEGPTYYLPLWQSSPIVYVGNEENLNGESELYPIFNQDGRTSVAEEELSPMEQALPELLRQRAVISRVRNLGLPNDAGDSSSGMMDSTDSGNANFFDSLDGKETKTVSREVEATNMWLEQLLGSSSDGSSHHPMEPISDIYYPIVLGSADSIRSDGHANEVRGHDEPENPIVGIFSMTIQWRRLLFDMHLKTSSAPPSTAAPSSSNGLYVVVENGCDQTFTYEIRSVGVADLDNTEQEDMDVTESFTRGDETTVVYLGVGDLHSPDLDEFAQTMSIDDLFKDSPSYSGLPITDDVCPYTIHWYPASKSGASDDPRLIMTATAMIFLFAGIIFMVYDCMIRRASQALFASKQVEEYIQTALSDGMLSSRPSMYSMYQDRAQAPSVDGKQAATPTRSSFTSPAMNNSSARRIDMTGNLVEMSESSDADFAKDKVDQSISSLFSAASAGDTEQNSDDSKPSMADVFPESSILFSDIIGLSRWSSDFQPAEVFQFLEMLHTKLDTLATQRRITKLEAVGGTYSCVAGMPEPLPDHSMIMARFASDMRKVLKDVTAELATTMGASIKKLQFRIGIHSGPVFGGVIRGQKLRFHLVGEVVDMAMRLERSGKRNRIHCSKTTATWLRADGVGHWVTPRDNSSLSGRAATLQSFWVEPSSDTEEQEQRYDSLSAADLETPLLSLSSVPENKEGIDTFEGSTSPLTSRRSTVKSTDVFKRTLSDPSLEGMEDKSNCMIDWNVDVLTRLLRTLVAKRKAVGDIEPTSELNLNPGKYIPKEGESASVLNEVGKMIDMPELEARVFFSSKKVDEKSVELEKVVLSQIRAFVSTIETMYGAHPYHNFEHASHIAMSLAIMLSKAAPAEQAGDSSNDTFSHDGFMKALAHHNRTFGISSDPLTQIAMIFAALVHDVDHPGVPNRQLIREFSPLVAKYQGKSMSQQNAVQRGWKLFAQEHFRELRNTICATPEELRRFRRVFVTSIMAMDLDDAEFNKRRNNRWKQTFTMSVEERWHNLQSNSVLYSQHELDAMATLSIEVMMQTASLAHTVQKWQVFLDWSECLLEQRYRAYKAGRHNQDPANYWYQEQLNFLDGVALPLAQKLYDSGVLGENGHEYRNNVLTNLEEWESRGMDEVASMLGRIHEVITPPTRLLTSDQHSYRSGRSTTSSVTTLTG